MIKKNSEICILKVAEAIKVLQYSYLNMRFFVLWFTTIITNKNKTLKEIHWTLK